LAAKPDRPKVNIYNIYMKYTVYNA
jgi:hypothetical protein